MSKQKFPAFTQHIGFNDITSSMSDEVCLKSLLDN